VQLSDARDAYQEFSGKASELARQLSFAGIAVVWVFRRETPGLSLTVVPSVLVGPALCFCCSLAADLLQYITATIAWGTFHRIEEQKLIKLGDDPALDAPRWINWPQTTFFILKLAFVAIGYGWLVSFLVRSMLHPVTEI